MKMSLESSGARLCAVALLLSAPLSASSVAAEPGNSSKASEASLSKWAPVEMQPLPLAALNALARQSGAKTSSVALAAEDDSAVRAASAASWEPGRAPNYLRAMASLNDAAAPFAHLLKTVVYSGEVSPQAKLAMGIRVAQLHRNAYVAAHLQRALRGCPNGQSWLSALSAREPTALPVADRLAIRYADLLTRDIHGVGEPDFQKLRGYFNDSQIIELTISTCLWNYFTRLTAGMNLPLEPWARPDAASSSFAPPAPFQAPFARVGLISDAELAAFADAAAPTPAPAAAPTGGAPVPARDFGLGIRIPNSKRAMMRAPLLGTAWFSYWNAVRGSEAVTSPTAPGGPSVGREMLLQVSFAVSMANGCRYCTLHQVQGLRRLNVDPAKLVSMRKDDSALTPRERLAVGFARKLARDPAGVAAADYAALQKELGVRGAGEVLLQTCAFNFMNRFTDNLNLPSEDEAVQTYREVYGSDYKPAPARRAARTTP